MDVAMRIAITQEKEGGRRGMGDGGMIRVDGESDGRKAGP